MRDRVAPIPTFLPLPLFLNDIDIVKRIRNLKKLESEEYELFFDYFRFLGINTN